VLLGGLSDYFGRKRMFIAEMIIFVAFLALLILCNDFLSLAICLFGLGLALGCDYPTAHMIISENIPSANRGKLVLGAFGFQALGAHAGTGVGCVVLILVPDLSAWRWMYSTALIPALAAKGAALINVLLIVGILFAVVLAHRAGRIRLQIIGFIGCAVGLFLATLSDDATGSTRIALIFAGFMLFNFMTNIGPNAQTYLLAGEVFPTEVRGMGAGFAAAFAKIGAVATAFLFPILLASIGTAALLWGLIVTSVLGAVVPWMYRIETTGLNLDQIGR
jgi:MFS family permease